MIFFLKFWIKNILFKRLKQILNRFIGLLAGIKTIESNNKIEFSYPTINSEHKVPGCGNLRVFYSIRSVSFVTTLINLYFWTIVLNIWVLQYFIKKDKYITIIENFKREVIQGLFGCNKIMAFIQRNRLQTNGFFSYKSTYNRLYYT